MRLVLFVLGLALCLQTGGLMAQGMLHLGITLPFAIGAVWLVLAWRWTVVQTWLDAKPRRRRVWRLLWAAFALWLVSVAVYFYYLSGVSAAERSLQFAPQDNPPVAIIVLGSGAPGGKVSPTLQSRLDLAARWAAQYPRAWVVASGGQGATEPRSEAAVMGEYLAQRAPQPVSTERLIYENKSTSTEENFAFTAPLLAAKGVDKAQAVLVVTNDFHGERSQRIARKLGFTNVQLALSTMPLKLRYNAWLREYFANISSKILGEV